MTTVLSCPYGIPVGVTIALADIIFPTVLAVNASEANLYRTGSVSFSVNIAIPIDNVFF
tara:strand:- start:8506 stop:8682 length:177 start_codon:yes stop_codon:yes gene_type:complete